MPPIVLKWEGVSDGDSNHKPTGPDYRLAGPEQVQLYLQKLGQQYMVASGRAEKGKKLPQYRLPRHRHLHVWPYPLQLSSAVSRHQIKPLSA